MDCHSFMERANKTIIDTMAHCANSQWIVYYSDYQSVKNQTVVYRLPN